MPIKKYSTIIILLSLLVLSCSSPEKASLSLYEKGKEYYRSGDIQKADETFKRLAEKYPDSPYAGYARAHFLYKEGLYYEASPHLSQSLQKDPKFLPGLLLSSELSLHYERPELAFYTSAIYQESGGEAAYGLDLDAKSLFMAGKIEDVGKLLERVESDIDDSPRLKLIEAKYNLHKGNFKDAIEGAVAASEISGNDPIFLKYTGDFFREIGLSDSADSYYSQALDAGKGDYALMADIIDSYIAMDYFHPADTLIELYSANADTSSRLFLLSREYNYKKGNIYRAILAVTEGMRLVGSSPTIYKKLAIMKADINDRLGAWPNFETAIDLAQLNGYVKPAIFDLVLDYVDVLIRDNRLMMAGPYVEEILDSLPNDFRSLWDMAYLSYSFQAEDVLRDYLSRMSEAAEGNPEYIARTGQIYAFMDSVRLADAIYTEVLQTDKFNLTAITGRLDLMDKAKEYQAALDFINGFDEYLSYVPEVSEYKLKLYGKSGELGSAIHLANKLIEIAPHNLSRYLRAIELARKGGRAEQVEELYAGMINDNSDNPDAYSYAAEYYLNSNDLKKAEELVNRAHKIDSEFAHGYTVQGLINLRRSNFDQAEANFKKALEYDRYAAEAYGHLAYVQLLRDDVGTRIINNARKAQQYGGNNPLFNYIIGRAFYKDKKYALARGGFESALEDDPDNPEYNYYAGLNYLAEGKTKEGEKALRRAINNGLDDEFKEKARKALKNI